VTQELISRCLKQTIQNVVATAKDGGATVNRYVYFLSAIFASNTRRSCCLQPCSRFEQEPEANRERYLTPSEQMKLMEVLVDDLEHLRVQIEVSLGTGV